MVDPLFTLLGVKTSHMAGGIAGGSVRYLVVGGGWWQGFCSVMAGLLAAVNLTPAAYFTLIHYFPTWNDPSVELAVCFLVGLTALLICEGFINMAKRWSRNPKFPPVGP